ncbi:MAG: glycosyltransferase family 39 protein [Bdellovibrionota bacterium]
MRNRLDRLLLGFLIAAGAVVIFLNLYFWTYYFNSDNAMIGLIAKSIVNRWSLPHFEWPIFVWHVGYQGVLFEAYAAAALFQIFGASPRVLDLVPAIVFVFLLVSLVQVVRKSYGLRAALLTGILVTVSAPTFYDHVLRTQPNYGETYAMGLLLILIYFRILRSWGDRAVLQHAALFGLIAGFAIYTYQQIAYFLAVIALHWLLVIERIKRQLNVRSSGAQLLFSAVIGVFGVVSFVLSWSTLYKIGVPLRWDPIKVVKLSLALLFLAHVFPLLKKISGTREPKRLAAFAGILLVCSWLGRFPKFYYNHILHYGSPDRTEMLGGLEFVWFKLQIALQGMGMQLNLRPLGIFRLALLLLFGISAVWFFFKTARDVKQFVIGKSGPESFSPLVFLPFVVLPAFVASAAIVDQLSARYHLVLILFFALALSNFLVWIAGERKIARGAWISAVLLIAVLGNNAITIGRSLAELPAKEPLQEVMEYLDSKGITRAYADYWYAYPIDLMSDERIIVEPLYTNYNPYYAEIVKAAPRIALFEEPERFRVPVYAGLLTIRDVIYRVTEEKAIRGIHVKILEKT